MRLVVPVLFVCAFTTVRVSGTSPCSRSGPVVTEAIAVLTGDKLATVFGTIRFTQPDGLAGPVFLQGVIHNLTEGDHGFHIHERGHIGDGCQGAGDHYNPDRYEHGALTDLQRHAGDLGNIQANAHGVATVDVAVTAFTLNGDYNIIGRTLIVHQDADDYGRGERSDSLTNGHSGARVACGVIGISAETPAQSR